MNSILTKIPKRKFLVAYSKISTNLYHEKVIKNQKLYFQILITYNIYIYIIQVIDHYENPRNVGSLNKSDDRVGTGLVGAPACGDVMKLQVNI